MFGIRKKKVENITINDLVKKQKNAGSYILDSNNVIVVVNNPDNYRQKYIMIHQRMENDKLIEINRWYLKNYYYGVIENYIVIKKHNLFMVQSDRGECNALYNYKEGNFIVERGVWDLIGRDNKVAGVSGSLPYVDYLERYNCFLASFSIKTDYQEDYNIHYINPVTQEKMANDFNLIEGKFFALLNTDGTIRGNKLFKGRTFSEIEEVIDLTNYSSLDEFKKERKDILEQRKQKLFLEYTQMLESRHDDSLSIYKDREVLNVLKYKK